MKILLPNLNLANTKELCIHGLMSNRMNISSAKYKILNVIFFFNVYGYGMRKTLFINSLGGEDLRALADDETNGNPQWSVATRVINLRFYPYSKSRVFS